MKQGREEIKKKKKVFKPVTTVDNQAELKPSAGLETSVKHMSRN